MLIGIIIISLTAAFVILFITKIGIRNWLAERSPKLIYEMLNCDFCLSFWVGLAITLIVIAIGADWYYIFLPVLTTPITRFLL